MYTQLISAILFQQLAQGDLLNYSVGQYETKFLINLVIRRRLSVHHVDAATRRQIELVCFFCQGRQLQFCFISQMAAYIVRQLLEENFHE